MGKRKSSPLDTGEWFDLIYQGERYKTEFGLSDQWATYRQYYRGIFPAMKTSDGKSFNTLPYNITFSLANTTIPKIYYRNPYINVTPRYGSMGTDVGLESTAKVVEAVDNWLIQELDLKHVMRRAALTGFLTGRPIWKVGYDSQYGYRPSPNLVDYGTLYEGDEGTTQVDKKGRQIEYHQHVKPNMPWVMNVDPDLFVVPFGVKTLEECAWVDHISLRPTEDVRRDPKYKNAKDIEGSHIDRVRLNSNKTAIVEELEKHIDITEIHEVRDARNKRIYAMTLGRDRNGGKFIRDDEDILQLEGIPFVSIPFNLDDEYFWVPSDARIFEPQQLEINETNTQEMLHRRIALLKFFYDLNKIDPEMVNHLLSGHILPGIAVDGPPGDAVMFAKPNMPQDLPMWKNMQEADVRTLMGHGRQPSGNESSSRQTAEQARYIQMGHESRMDMKRDAMGDALQQIMRKVNQTIFKFWSADRVVQVVGYDGARYWVKYNNKMIAGEYNMKVDVESLSPMTKAMKRKELIQLVQALANNPRANLDYLLRQLLKEFDYLDVMKILPEAPETAGGRPMEMREFQGVQSRMTQNPGELKERTGATAAALGGMLL